MGVGAAQGKDKAEVAAKMAISSPLLETSISGARGILVNFTCPSDFALDELDIAADLITNEAHPDARVIIGYVVDDDLDDEIRVTVIATGFVKEEAPAEPAAPATPAKQKLEDLAKPEDTKKSSDYETLFDIFNKK
jgi:cell division protein FtsZ